MSRFHFLSQRGAFVQMSNTYTDRVSPLRYPGNGCGWDTGAGGTWWVQYSTNKVGWELLRPPAGQACPCRSVLAPPLLCHRRKGVEGAKHGVSVQYSASRAEQRNTSAASGLSVRYRGWEGVGIKWAAADRVSPASIRGSGRSQSSDNKQPALSPSSPLKRLSRFRAVPSRLQHSTES